MNEKMITLGNRKYRVGFEEGQEQELANAVQLFDEELNKLTASGTGMRESQHLMLGGLMIAYRFADQVVGQSEAKGKVVAMESELARARDQVTSLVKSEKDLQARIKQLGDEKVKLVSEAESASGSSEEIDALKAEIAELKNAPTNAGMSEVDQEQLLDELKTMRTELTKLKSVEGELEALKAENAKLRESASAEPKAAAPQSAEDGIASALGEIVSGLEGLAK